MGANISTQNGSKSDKRRKSKKVRKSKKRLSSSSSRVNRSTGSSSLKTQNSASNTGRSQKSAKSSDRHIAPSAVLTENEAGNKAKFAPHNHNITTDETESGISSQDSCPFCSENHEDELLYCGKGSMCSRRSRATVLSKKVKGRRRRPVRQRAPLMPSQQP